MAETFYGALGVAADADVDAIQAAYREHVKQFHPDVTDDPDATRTFKRLTTARDTLIDDRQRTLYDTLGHDTYVRRHIRSDLWEPTPRSDGFTTDRSQPTATDGAGGTQRRTASTDQSEWLGTDWDGPRGHRRGRGPRAGRNAGGWQMASEAYRRSPRTPRGRSGSQVAGIYRALRALGPWVVVHLAFIGSAAATAWFTIAQPDRVFEVTPPVMGAGVLMVLFVLSLSSLHVVSVLYS